MGKIKVESDDEAILPYLLYFIPYKKTERSSPSDLYKILEHALLTLQKQPQSNSFNS